MLLAYPLLRPDFMQRLPKAFLLGLALPMLLPLLQLLPLPFSLWQALPGREIYAEPLAAFHDAGMRPLSVVPRATWEARLALLPPLAAFLAVVGLHEAALRPVVRLFIGIAVVQGLSCWCSSAAAPPRPSAPA